MSHLTKPWSIQGNLEIDMVYFICRDWHRTRSSINVSCWPGSSNLPQQVTALMYLEATQCRLVFPTLFPHCVSSRPCQLLHRRSVSSRALRLTISRPRYYAFLDATPESAADRRRQQVAAIICLQPHSISLYLN
jgi:hypothetical protein